MEGVMINSCVYHVVSGNANRPSLPVTKPSNNPPFRVIMLETSYNFCFDIVGPLRCVVNLHLYDECIDKP